MEKLLFVLRHYIFLLRSTERRSLLQNEAVPRLKTCFKFTEFEYYHSYASVCILFCLHIITHVLLFGPGKEGSEVAYS